VNLDLEKYSLDLVAFEIRYESNWMHWDRAGAVWTDAFRKFPNLRIATGQPQQTTFLLGRSIQLQILNDRMSIVSAAPMDLEATGAAADEITRLVIKHFGLSTFSRVGHRYHLFEPKPDPESSSSELLALLHLHKPAGKHFGIEGVPLRPTFTMRWEKANQGITIRLSAETRTIDFHPGIDMAPYVEPVKRNIDGLMIDLDVYSSGAIPVGSFMPSHLISDSLRVAKRDLSGFLSHIGQRSSDHGR
jgi:hypothetical protein